jgi:hypothetical protein
VRYDTLNYIVQICHKSYLPSESWWDGEHVSATGTDAKVDTDAAATKSLSLLITSRILANPGSGDFVVFSELTSLKGFNSFADALNTTKYDSFVM